MSQPKLKLDYYKNFPGFIDKHAVVVYEVDEYLILLAGAKTEKTAYKRAAAKLRKLADEAERLAEES